MLQDAVLAKLKLAALFLLIAWAAVLIGFNAAYEVCECSASDENAYRAVVMLSLIAVWGYTASLAYHVRSRFNVLQMVFLMLLFAGLMFVSSVRHAKFRGLALSFDGQVVEKYISENRGARVMVLGDGTVLESVARHVWEDAELGDWVYKEYCVNEAYVDGEKYAWRKPYYAR